MRHDVFVSYADKDRALASAICARLEERGVRCWVAYRDLTPSREWGEEIANALDSARILVLVFSTHSNASKWVRREVSGAVDREMPIIPFRIESVVPHGGLRLALESVHWLDALTAPVEAHLGRLADVVESILGGAAPPSPAPPPEPVHQPTDSRRRNPAILAGLLAVLALFLILTIDWSADSRPLDEDVGSEVRPTPTPASRGAVDSDSPTPQRSAESLSTWLVCRDGRCSVSDLLRTEPSVRALHVEDLESGDTSRILLPTKSARTDDPFVFLVLPQSRRLRVGLEFVDGTRASPRSVGFAGSDEVVGRFLPTPRGTPRLQLQLDRDENHSLVIEPPYGATSLRYRVDGGAYRTVSVAQPIAVRAAARTLQAEFVLRDGTLSGPFEYRFNVGDDGSAVVGVRSANDPATVAVCAAVPLGSPFSEEWRRSATSAEERAIRDSLVSRAVATRTPGGSAATSEGLARARVETERSLSFKQTGYFRSVAELDSLDRWSRAVAGRLDSDAALVTSLVRTAIPPRGGVCVIRAGGVLQGVTAVSAQIGAERVVRALEGPTDEDQLLVLSSIAESVALSLTRADGSTATTVRIPVRR